MILHHFTLSNEYLKNHYGLLLIYQEPLWIIKDSYHYGLFLIYQEPLWIYQEKYGFIRRNMDLYGFYIGIFNLIDELEGFHVQSCT